jgi:hypothetical protein
MTAEEVTSPIPFETYEVIFELPYAIWIPDDEYEVVVNERFYRIRTQARLRHQDEVLGPGLRMPGLVPLNDHQGVAGVASVAVQFRHEGRQSIEEIIRQAIAGVARLVRVYRWISDRYYLRPLTRIDISHFRILYLDSDGKPINPGTLVGPPGPYGPPPLLNPEQVRHLKTALLDDSSPFLEYQLLHEAARAFDYGDYRWAAYNAISALEVAVSHSFLETYALGKGVSKRKWKGVVIDLTKSRIRSILTPLLFEPKPPLEVDLIRLLEARNKAVHRGLDVPRPIAQTGFEAVKLYLDRIHSVGQNK